MRSSKQMLARYSINKDKNVSGICFLPGITLSCEVSNFEMAKKEERLFVIWKNREKHLFLQLFIIQTKNNDLKQF